MLFCTGVRRLPARQPSSCLTPCCWITWLTFTRVTSLLLQALTTMRLFSRHLRESHRPASAAHSPLCNVSCPSDTTIPNPHTPRRKSYQINLTKVRMISLYRFEYCSSVESSPTSACHVLRTCENKQTVGVLRATRPLL